jgi:NADPH2:quinone reductase
MGATRAIAVGEEDFVRVVKDATGGGADVALDIVGGSYIQPTLKALAPDGRLVFLAFLEDATASVNFGPVLLKRLTLTGSTLRGREVAFKTRLAEAVRRDVWPLVESGAMTVRVHGEYPLQRAAEAHAEMEASRHAGKLVLRPEV